MEMKIKFTWPLAENLVEETYDDVIFGFDIWRRIVYQAPSFHTMYFRCVFGNFNILLLYLTVLSIAKLATVKEITKSYLFKHYDFKSSRFHLLTKRLHKSDNSRVKYMRLSWNNADLNEIPPTGRPIRSDQNQNSGNEAPEVPGLNNGAEPNNSAGEIFNCD